MSNRRKPPPNPKSLATFTHAQDGVRTQAVVRDSQYSEATEGGGVLTMNPLTNRRML